MAAASIVSAEVLGPRDFDGWFTEVEAMWKGQRFSLKVKEVLHHDKTEYQEILVFESESYGRVLALDGVIQFTTKDECSYQEMMAHVPLFTHKSPESVLIVGGGDGGVLREVTKHGRVSEITLCEIDQGVINASKKFFGDSMATAFDDPCVSVEVCDAAEYVSRKTELFDVIIVDSSDPTDEDSPATSLYSDKFLANCAKALKPGGIICMQGECMWLESHQALMKKAIGAMAPYFGVRDYAIISVPTYPCGQIGMLLGAKHDEKSMPSMKDRELFFRKPRRHLDYAQSTGAFKYYGPYMHEAAFVLPPFARNIFGDDTCGNFIASSDLPEGLPTPEEFQMLFWGMLGGGLVAGMLVGRYLLPRFI